MPDQKKAPEPAKTLIAKKDWRILTGSWKKKEQRFEFDFDIKKGQDVSKLPERFLKVLKSENVI